MKRAMLFVLLSVVSVQSYADCEQAYVNRHVKRIKRNKNLIKYSLFAVGGAGYVLTAGAGGAMFSAATNKAIEGTTLNALVQGLGAVWGLGVASIGVYESQQYSGSTKFFKIVHAIREAKEGRLSDDVKKRLSKKRWYKRSTAQEKEYFNQQALDIIQTSNEANAICAPNRKGKVKTMNFRRFIRYVSKKIIRKA